MSNINSGHGVDKFYINEHTTTADVKNFLELHASDAGKLRGRKIGENSYELYVSTKSHSMSEKLSGTAREHNKAAADGIALVMRNAKASLSSAGMVDKESSVLFKRLDQATSMKNGKALNSAAIEKIADKLASLENLLTPVKDHGGDVPPPSRVSYSNGPTVTLDFSGGVGAPVVTRLRDPDAGKEDLVADLSTTIRTALQNGNLPSDKLEALLLSSGTSLKTQLKASLLADLRTATGNPKAQLTPEFDSVLGEAFADVSKTLLGARETGSTPITYTNLFEIQVTVDVPKLDLPDGTGGTASYTPVKMLGSGGYAEVFLYRNDANPKDTIAVKIQKPVVEGGEDMTGVFVREAVNHKALSNLGDPLILGLKANVKLNDGRIAIAMEGAPNGSVAGLKDILSNQPVDGPTPKERKVMIASIIQESLEGIVALRTANTIHKDYHGRNLLLTETGHVKIADYGTTERTGATGLRNMKEDVDNPVTTAPEVVTARFDVYSEGETTKSSFRENAKEILDLMPAKNKTQGVSINYIWNNIYSKVEEVLNEKNDVIVTSNTQDVYSLGTTAYELFSGKNYCGDLNASSDITSRIADLYREKKSGLIPDDGTTLRDAGAVGYLTGDQEIDDLLVGLLHPDPTKRLTPEEALALPIFSNHGVGDDETFRKIAELTRPT